MGGKRSPWRALRPVFLAGAATLTWLTFSSSTASADTAPEATFLLGGVTTSVSSVTDELPVSAAVASGAAPAPTPTAPTPGSSSGMVQPIAGEVPGLAEHIVPPGPVVNNVVPAGAVSVIAVPIAESVDVAVAEAVEAVAPPVTEVLPVLEPALQPVEELVSARPVLPEIPVEVPDVEVPSEVVPGEEDALAPTNVAMATAPAASAEPSATGIVEVTGTGTPAAGPVDVATTDAALQTAVLVPDAAEEQPVAADPSPALAQAPPAPGSGTGSSTTSAPSSGSAACLSVFTLDLPPSVAVRAGETSEHAPAPVSFDPGSSPD